MNWLTVLTALGGASITGLVAYLVAHRQRSGSIKTTEASELWDKFQSHNESLGKELGDLRVQMQALGLAHEELREAAMECEQRVSILQGRLRKLESDTEAATIIGKAVAEAEKIREQAMKLRREAENMKGDPA